MADRNDSMMNSLINKSLYEQLEQQQLRNTDSQQQQFKEKQEQLKNIIEKKRRRRKVNAKVIIGSRFSCDIGEFFKFNKKRQTSTQDGHRLSLVQQLSTDYVSWMVLVFYLLLNGVIPPWIASISANRLIRNSWLFFLQTFLIIPFVMYERRICKQQEKCKYSLKYIFTMENIRKIYISSASLSIFQIVLWLCFDWTWLSHSLILGSLSNFFLSLIRSFNKQNHRLQPGGQILILFGVFMIFLDSFTLVNQDIPKNYYKDLNYAYARRQGYQRLIADVICFGVSFVVAQCSKLSVDIKGNLPPFLSIMCVNAFVCVNTSLAGFFLVGNDFDWTPGYGWFSLFTNATFTSFLFETTLISVGIFISFALIAKLYPNPTIPSMVMVFDPFVSSFFLEVYGLQHMPGSYSSFGFMLLIPGMMIILVGQHIYVQVQKVQQIEDVKKLERLVSQHVQKRQTRALIKSKRETMKVSSQHMKSRIQSGLARSPPQKKEMELPRMTRLDLTSMEQILQQGGRSEFTYSSDQNQKKQTKKQKKNNRLQSLRRFHQDQQY